MLFLPLLLIIPVNVLLICASILNLSLSKRELISSSQNYLDLVVAQAERDISEADTEIQSYIGNDAGFLRLNSYTDTSLENSDFYLDLMATFQKLETFELDKTNVSTAYLLLDGRQELWKRTSEMTGRPEEQELLPLLAESKSEIFSYLTGDALHPAFFKFFRGPSCWTGYLLNCAGYLEKLKADHIVPDTVWVGNREQFAEFSGLHSGGIILSREVEDANLVFASVYRRDAFDSSISGLVTVLRALSILAFIVAPLLVYWYYRQVYYPTKALKKGIDKIREGDLSYRVPLIELPMSNEFTDLARYFNEMMDELEKMQKDNYELKLRQQEMLLNYYSQQIRPHFILNALNTIYTCRENEWDYAKEMLLYLMRYFRYVVNIREKDVALSEEMGFLKTYLEIQKQRLGDYFYPVVAWDHELENVRIPPLVLNTFAENSVKYALENDRICCIAATAERVDEKLMRIRISDTGKGFPQEVLSSIKQYMETGIAGDNLGIGIVNTLERLKMYYGKPVQVEFRNENGAVTELLLPIGTAAKETGDKK